MKKIQIDFEVYQWLCTLGVLKLEQKTILHNQIELDDLPSRLLENGILFSQFLQQVRPEIDLKNEYATQFNEKTKDLKETNTPATRLYNWNILNDLMKQIGIGIDGEIKSMIVSGDTDMINEVFKDIYVQFKRNGSQKLLSSMSSPNLKETQPLTQSMVQKSLPSNNLENNSMGPQQSMKSPKFQRNKSNFTMTQDIDRDEQEFAAYMTQMGQISQTVDTDGAVNLNSIDARKPLDQTTSLLEYFITGLCRHIGLQPQQSVALLSNGNQYLAHVMVKGVKANHTPLVNWLKQIELYTQQLVTFMEADNTNIQNVLNTIKPGLLSKNEDTAVFTARIYVKLVSDLGSSQLLPRVYDWFCQMNGGLATFVMSIKRHRTVCEPLANLILTISKTNIADILTNQLQKWMELKHDYLESIFWLFPFLTEKQFGQDELIQTKVIEGWVNQTSAIIQDNVKNDADIRRTSVMLLSQIWLTFPEYIQQGLNKSTVILDLIKKSTRDHSIILRFTAFDRMFQLLDRFTAQNNPIFSLIYQKLTFCFIENHADIELREFFIRNFKIAFSKFPAMPVEVLIEPLLKQIQVSQGHSYILNVIDIDFLRFVVQHPQVKLKLAIQLFELLMHIYLEKIVFSRYIFEAVLVLAQKFLTDEVFQDYLVRTTRTAFTLFVASAKASTKLGGSKAGSNASSVGSTNSQNINRQNEQEIINMQKRALTIELYQKILGMQSLYVNQQVKYIVANSFNQLQAIGHENKGLIALLSMFGPPVKVLQEVVQYQPEVRISENAAANDPDFIEFLKPGAQPSQPSSINNIDPSQSLVVDSVSKSQINNLIGSKTPQVGSTDPQNDEAFMRKFGIGYQQQQSQPMNPQKKQELDEYFHTRESQTQDNDLRQSSLPRINKGEDWKTMPLSGQFDNQRYSNINEGDMSIFKDQKNFSMGIKSAHHLGQSDGSLILDKSQMGNKNIKNRAVLEKLEKQYMEQYIKEKRDQKILQRKKFLDSQIEDIKSKRFEQIAQKSIAERVQREHMTKEEIEQRENFKKEGSLLKKRLEDFHLQLEEKKQKEQKQKENQTEEEKKAMEQQKVEIQQAKKKVKQEQERILKVLMDQKVKRHERSQSIESLKGLDEAKAQEEVKQLAAEYQQQGEKFITLKKEDFDKNVLPEYQKLNKEIKKRPWEDLTQKVEEEFKKKYEEQIQKEIQANILEEQEKKEKKDHEQKNNKLSKAYAQLQLDREKFIKEIREVLKQDDIKQVFGWVDPQQVKDHKPDDDRKKRKEDKKWNEDVLVPEYPENQDSFRDVIEQTFFHFIHYNKSQELGVKGNMLDLHGFVSFCKVFEITPHYIPQEVACHIFQASIRQDMYNPEKDIANLQNFIKSYEGQEAQAFKNQIPAYKWYIKASALENEGMNLDKFQIALIRLAGKLKGKVKKAPEVGPPSTAPNNANREIKTIDVKEKGKDQKLHDKQKFQIQYKPDVIYDDIKEIQGFTAQDLTDFFTQVELVKNRKELQHKIKRREIEREKIKREKRDIEDAKFKKVQQLQISQDDNFIDRNQSFIQRFESPTKFQQKEFEDQIKQDRKEQYNEIKHQGQETQEQLLQKQKDELEKDFQYKDKLEQERKEKEKAQPPPAVPPKNP